MFCQKLLRLLRILLSDEAFKHFPALGQGIDYLKIEWTSLLALTAFGAVGRLSNHLDVTGSQSLFQAHLRDLNRQPERLVYFYFLRTWLTIIAGSAKSRTQIEPDFFHLAAVVFGKLRRSFREFGKLPDVVN